MNTRTGDEVANPTNRMLFQPGQFAQSPEDYDPNFLIGKGRMGTLSCALNLVRYRSGTTNQY